MTEAEKLEAARRILAYSRLSWWEYASTAGLPTSVGRRRQRIERGPYAVPRRPATKPEPSKKPAYDYIRDDWRL